MKKITLLLTILIAVAACSPNQKPEITTPPNILFIAVDDLRPELNCYGASHIQSPNIDKLASQGVMFTEAYCNVPVCGASRASLLTGARPTRHRFINYFTRVDKDYPEAITLPQLLRQNGYYTISNGKIFHDKDDTEAASWDENWRPHQANSWRDYQDPQNIQLDNSDTTRGPAYENLDIHDTAYFDGKIAQKAIADLKKLKQQDKPFFLAVGFLKPHLPFNAPRKYWNMYDPASISLPENYYVPENAPEAAIHNFGELRAYAEVPKEGPVSDELAHKLIHGYYACVSYTDAQIGRLMQALEEEGLKENTIVILWGDHGWNLGEHTLWCKHANFRTSLRVPMLLAGPGIPANKKIGKLVEFVDIYPTLAALAGIAPPTDQLDGTSMLALWEDDNPEWKDQVISKYHDGLSIKTDDYLYTEWSRTDEDVYARMLYNHVKDPKENVNISERPENSELVEQLKQEMLKHRGDDFNTSSE
jgi:arylsulfatase A-like enzyme